MDEYGQGLYADLRFHFGTDLLDLFREGSDLTPQLVLALVARLPVGCMTHSMMEGGDDWQMYLDRDVGWYINTDLYNMLGQLLRATGNWAKTPPKIEPYPLPGKTANKFNKPKTLKDAFALFGGAGQH